MLMSDNKKKAHMIIANMGGQVSDDMDQQDYQDADGHDEAAKEVLDAVHAKDPAALKEALKSFISMCMDEDSEPADDMSAEEESAE